MDIKILILGAGFGAVVGFAIHKLIPRSPSFYRKLAKRTVAKLPQEISLKPIESHAWSNRSEYANASAALKGLGFEKHTVFLASPQKWVIEMWLSKNDGFFAAILDAPLSGIHTEIVVEYKDGSTVSFENTDECGQQHLENHNWIHCGSITPDKLLQVVLQDRRPDYVGLMQLADCLKAYERAVNQSLAWRRRIGYTPDEIKRLQERARNKRSLLNKLS